MSTTERKIWVREKIREEVGRLRKQGKRIVTTCGTFDILHRGHIKSIHEAKKQGDILIVCLNTDLSVKKYKGQERPIMDQRNRAEILAALGDVDYVVIFDEPDPRSILEEIKPDIHVKSKSGFKEVERGIIESNGGKIVLIEDLPGISTTKIIKKIKKEH